MLNVIYEDNHIIVVEKPCNIPSQGDNTGDEDMLTIIKKYIKEKYNKPGEVYLGLVHRLDRPVGGVMVFARTSKAASRLSEAIRVKDFSKKYLAVVEGIFEEKSGVLENYLFKDETLNKSRVVSKDKRGAKLARLNYEVLEEVHGKSLVKINLETGRHHQIRVQFSNVGHPLVGDQKYGKSSPGVQIALWAYELEFKHPTKDETMKFSVMPQKVGAWKEFSSINKENDIDVAAKVIKEGGLVLFPTETVYGIGANALDDDAVKNIFVAKGREQDNPLILHISDMKMLDQIVDNVSELEHILMDAFWPGPFTIILNKKPGIANVATCNGDTVGVRMPSNKIAHDLIKKSNLPIAAPSANISGKPSGTKLIDIIDELKDKVDYILDGGESDIGLESTVVRVIGNEVRILRPGKITKEDIEKIVNNVKIDKNIMGQLGVNERVLSPGMKYRHYAPSTNCTLIYGEDNENMVSEIIKIARAKNNVLILASTENKERYSEFECIDIGSKNDLLEISHNIFSLLRKIDTYNVDMAIIEGVKPEGIGLAIMNRLIRACEHNYIQL